MTLSLTAPAHPHATRVAVYPALLKEGAGDPQESETGNDSGVRQLWLKLLIIRVLFLCIMWFSSLCFQKAKS